MGIFDDINTAVRHMQLRGLTKLAQGPGFMYYGNRPGHADGASENIRRGWKMVAATPAVAAGTAVGAAKGAIDESGGWKQILDGAGRGAVIGAKVGYRDAPVAYASMAAGVGDFGKDVLPGAADAIVGIPGALYGLLRYGSPVRGYNEAAEAAGLGKPLDWLQERIGWNGLMRRVGEIQDKALEAEKERRYGKSGPRADSSQADEWREYVDAHRRARGQTELLTAFAAPSVGVSSLKAIGAASKSDKVARGMNVLDSLANNGLNLDNAATSVATAIRKAK